MRIGGELWIGTSSEEEESRVRRIRQYGRRVQITLTEQPESELTNVHQTTFQCLAELVFNADVDHANFRISQVWRNRTDAAKATGPADGGCKRRKKRGVGSIREGVQNRLGLAGVVPGQGRQDQWSRC